MCGVRRPEACGWAAILQPVLNMLAARISPLDPAIHLRLQGCASDLAACLPSDCIAQIEDFVMTPRKWLRIDLSNLPGTGLNLTSLQDGLSRHVGRADMEGTISSSEHEQQLYVGIATLPFVRTICEIGFNAGHSAQLWLAANPNARGTCLVARRPIARLLLTPSSWVRTTVVMFDKGSKATANERGWDWLHMRPELRATGRIELIKGCAHAAP